MRSIRRQMALTVSGVAGVVVLAGGFGLYLTLRLALRTQFDASLQTKAQALVTASMVDDGELEIDLDVQAFAGFGSSSPGDYFEIYAPDGSTLDRSPSLGSTHLPELAFPAEASEGFAAILLPEEIDGRAYWRTFTPKDDDGNPFDELRIVVASDLSKLKRTLRIVAIAIAGFGGGGLLVSLLLLRLVVVAGFKPLDRLGADVQRLDERRLAQRLALDDLPVELKGVAEKLNELLDRLEASFARERRFSSHAAHELRTPLAELKAMTELGASWPDELTAEHVGEMLEVISELEALIEKLSLLARVETGGDGSLERIDLEASVSDCLARQKVEIARRNLEIDRCIEAGEFRSDPVLWRAILQNLVDNAIAYAPDGSRVEVAASPASLSVANEAPDLEPADLERLFERFWRKPGTPGTGKHSGLGLSIVRSSAEFLGARCRATLEDGRLRITVAWLS